MQTSPSVMNHREPRVDSRPGKYLIFELAHEEFGISVLQVREIMKTQEITAVPRAPHHLQGVINLRGHIVPVVNLRRKFDMPEQEDTERTCIVVVGVHMNGGEQPIGLVVDSVVEVLLVNASEIEDTPHFGREIDTAYVRGMATIKGKVKILLDIDSTLSDQGTMGWTANIGQR